MEKRIIKALITERQEEIQQIELIERPFPFESFGSKSSSSAIVYTERRHNVANLNNTCLHNIAAHVRQTGGVQAQKAYREQEK